MEKHTHLWSLFDVWVNWIMICQHMSHHVKSIIVSLKSQDFHLFGVLLSCFHVALFIQCCPSQWHHGHHRNPQVCGSKAGNFFQPIWDEFWHIHPENLCKLTAYVLCARKHPPVQLRFILIFLVLMPSVGRDHTEKKKHKPPRPNASLADLASLHANISAGSTSQMILVSSTSTGKHHIVDGRNPAPVDRQFIPLFTGCFTSQVVQDFSHEQYF